MSLPDGIQPMPIKEWENGHHNFKVALDKNASYSLHLPQGETDQKKQYAATTANMQWLIQNAINNGTQIRPLGNGWSFSDVAVSNGGLIDTKALRLVFRIHDSFVNKQYLDSGKTSKDLIFVQCGVSVFEVHRTLQAAGRSLKATGASNGQSVAGGTATGTHGAAYKFGSSHDAIIGLHIVVSPSRHVWIERKSNPAASQQFIDWLGAELIQDDDMFNSVVVGFGSFGIIHGILVETEPLFLLEEHRLDGIPYNQAVINAVQKYDFSGLPMPFPVEAPDRSLYHFEVIINPHRFEENNPDKGVYIRLLYKIPYRTDYTPKPQDPKFVYGDETLGVIQSLLDSLGPINTLLVPALVNKLFPLAFKANGAPLGTLGEIFINTRFRGKAASASTAINIADVDKAVKIIIKANKENPFAGALGLRFVKGTKATLGFTKFENNCVLEMDGVDAQVSRDFFETVWSQFETANLPYTLHWGKINFILNESRLRKMYGDAKVNKWLECRTKLLSDPAVRKVFTNNFMIRCGLDKLPPANPPIV